MRVARVVPAVVGAALLLSCAAGAATHARAAGTAIVVGAAVDLTKNMSSFAAPAIQEFLAAKILTVSPCIGTDQMGPARFGAAGNTAFSFGNAAQDEGAA